MDDVFSNQDLCEHILSFLLSPLEPCAYTCVNRAWHATHVREDARRRDQFRKRYAERARARSALTDAEKKELDLQLFSIGKGVSIILESELQDVTALLDAGASGTRFLDHELSGPNLGDLVDSALARGSWTELNTNQMRFMRDLCCSSGSCPWLTNRYYVGNGGEQLLWFLLNTLACGDSWGSPPKEITKEQEEGQAKRIKEVALLLEVMLFSDECRTPPKESEESKKSKESEDTKKSDPWSQLEISGESKPEESKKCEETNETKTKEINETNEYDNRNDERNKYDNKNDERNKSEKGDEHQDEQENAKKSDEEGEKVLYHLFYNSLPAGRYHQCLFHDLLLKTRGRPKNPMVRLAHRQFVKGVGHQMIKDGKNLAGALEAAFRDEYEFNHVTNWITSLLKSKEDPQDAIEWVHELLQLCNHGPLSDHFYFVVNKLRSYFDMNIFDTFSQSRESRRVAESLLNHYPVARKWIFSSDSNFSSLPYPLLSDLVRRRERKILTLVSQLEPIAFAEAAPVLLKFAKSKNVRGKKERIIKLLECAAKAHI